MSHAKIIFGLAFMGAGAYAIWRFTRADSGGVSDSQPGLPANPVSQATGSAYSTQAAQQYEKDLNMWTTPAAGQRFDPAFKAASAKYGLPDGLLSRVAYQESHFRDDIITGKVKSPVGALGLMQFMPAVARQYGIDPLNPEQAIDGGARLLRDLFKRFGNWKEAVAAYNWGQGNVARKGLAAAPAETKTYFASILSDIGLT